MTGIIIQDLFTDCQLDSWFTVWCKGNFGNKNRTKWYKVSEVETAVKAAQTMDALGYDVYVSTGTTREQGMPFQRIGYDKYPPYQATAFFMDVDTLMDPKKEGKRVPNDPEEAAAALRSLTTSTGESMAPSCIICSGQGCHAYWYLTEPLTITDNDEVKDMMRRFADGMRDQLEDKGFPAADLDTFASEPVRVLRVDGTTNRKNDKPLPVYMMYHTDKCYQLEDLMSEARAKAQPASTQMPASRPSSPSDISDDQYFSAGLENDQRLQDAWCGNFIRDDESANDAELMERLIYWSRDRDQMTIINRFLQSPWAKMQPVERQKKYARKDYLPRTFAAANKIVLRTAADDDRQYRAANEPTVTPITDTPEDMELQFNINTVDGGSEDKWLTADRTEMGGPAHPSCTLSKMALTTGDRLAQACMELDGNSGLYICRWFHFSPQPRIDPSDLARAIIRVHGIHLNGSSKMVRTVGDHERSVNKQTVRRFAEAAIRSIRGLYTDKQQSKTIAETAAIVEDLLYYIPNEPTGKLEMINAADLQNMEIPDLAWIVQDLLCEGLAALGAPQKSRKTFLALDLAVSVATGKPFMGKSTSMGQVLYLNLEGNNRQSKARLEAMGVNPYPTNLTFVHTAPKLDNFLMEYIERQWLKNVTAPRLIVIDTIAKVEGAPQFGKDAYHAGVDMYGPLHEFAMKHHLCILAITHTRKGGTKGLDNRFDAITGSNALIATSATNMLIDRDKEDKDRAILRLQGRELINAEDLAIKFDSNTVRWICEGSAADAKRIQEEVSTATEYMTSPIVSLIMSHCPNANDQWSTYAADIADEVWDTSGLEIDKGEVGRLINKYEPMLKLNANITIGRKRSKLGRMITFKKEDLTQAEKDNPFTEQTTEKT